MCIPRPIACTRPTRWPPPPPDDYRRTNRTCRTFRCGPRMEGKSAAPSSLLRATSWCRRIIRRSNCGCSRGGPSRQSVKLRDIFGLSPLGFANPPGIAREEASAYIKKYFERFPGIRAYMDATRDFCRAHGYVETLFGRKCHYPDIKASNASVRAFNERAAINARLQGTAADIIRRAMIRMEEALAEKKLSAQMLLQVHDELIFEVPDDEVAATLPVVQHVMQDAPFPAVLLSLPLHVDARAADNWDEAH